jgi:hypothetical protein
MTTAARSAINSDGNDRQHTPNRASLSEVRPGRSHENPRCKVGRQSPGWTDERGSGRQVLVSRDDVVRGTKNSYIAWVLWPCSRNQDLLNSQRAGSSPKPASPRVSARDNRTNHGCAGQKQRPREWEGWSGHGIRPRLRLRPEHVAVLGRSSRVTSRLSSSTKSARAGQIYRPTTQPSIGRSTAMPTTWWRSAVHWD